MASVDVYDARSALLEKRAEHGDVTIDVEGELVENPGHPC